MTRSLSVYLLALGQPTAEFKLDSGYPFQVYFSNSSVRLSFWSPWVWIWMLLY